jgi:hypothetical protein
VTVATGTESTGDPLSKGVTTRHPRGRVAAEVAGRNEQLQFAFDGDLYRPENRINREGRVTYFLLIRVADTQLRAELSRPIAVGPDGRPTDWIERLHLQPIERGHAPRGGDPEPPSDFDVDVRRK